jgi:hypothetical protein
MNDDINMYIDMKLITFLILIIHINVLGQKYVVEQDQRIKDSFYYEHTDISYFSRPLGHITPFGGYRFIIEDKNEWKHHSRFHVGANIKFAGKFGKIVNRNRFEFTPGHALGDLDSNNDIRFRNRIKYYTPFSFTKYKITPNVSDEFFFDLQNRSNYNRNRFALGLGATIGNFKPEVYYFAEFKQSGGWTRTDVFGFLVKYEF